MDNNKVKKNNMFFKRFFYHLLHNIADGLELFYGPLIFTGMVLSIVTLIAGKIWPTATFVILLLLAKTFLDMINEKY